MADLPLQLLPTAFAKWNVLDPIRPCKIGKVAYASLEPPGKAPMVVSSVYGQMKELVLFYPAVNDRETKRPYRYLNFMLELVASMPERGRTFIVVVENYESLPSDYEEELKKTAKKAGHLLKIVLIDYSKRTLSPWVQDAFLPISFDGVGGRQTYLVESKINEQNREASEALVQTRQANSPDDLNGVQYIKSSLPFVGGNVLAGEDFVLIGLHFSSKETLQEMGDQWLGKRHIVIGAATTLIQSWVGAKQTSDKVRNYYESDTRDQALFHLDLFISLAGKVWRRAFTECFVIGKPEVGFEGLEEAPKDVQQLVKDLIEKTNAAIDVMIEQLKQGMKDLGKKFKIIRNPLPLTYYDEKEERNGEIIYNRYWSWATANNCLVEQYYNRQQKQVRRVFLPSYGTKSNYAAFSDTSSTTKYGDWSYLAYYDKKNMLIWQKLNYEVVLLKEDYNPFIRRQGSLNCLTNCIKRVNAKPKY